MMPPPDYAIRRCALPCRSPPCCHLLDDMLQIADGLLMLYAIRAADVAFATAARLLLPPCLIRHAAATLPLAATLTIRFAFMH